MYFLSTLHEKKIFQPVDMFITSSSSITLIPDNGINTSVSNRF
ncbi:unnamed protein product, partial [Rotaria sp. Silwood1]